MKTSSGSYNDNDGNDNHSRKPPFTKQANLFWELYQKYKSTGKLPGDDVFWKEIEEYHGYKRYSKRYE
jgi:hypothetical protein